MFVVQQEQRKMESVDTLNSEKQVNLISAKVLGTNAYKDGKQRVPAHDAELMSMIGNDRDLNISLMKQWIKGWEMAWNEDKATGY